MTDFTRRDIARLGGATLVAALAARSGISFAAEAQDPLKYVDPELHPAARRVIQMDGDGSQWNDEFLRKMRAGGGAPPSAPRLPDVPVEELKIPVGSGQPDVTIFVINAKPGGSRPGILHTHGGG